MYTVLQGGLEILVGNNEKNRIVNRQYNRKERKIKWHTMPF